MLALLDLIPKWVWAALVATLAATSCKLKWDNSGLTIEIEKGKTYVAQLETAIAQSNEASAQALAANEAKARQAERDASVRMAALSRDAAAAKSERDRLRVAVAAYTAPRLTALGKSLAPELDHASPFPELFLQCTDRYVELAAKADGHASDVRTLIDAWPK
jgi:multidrug resistance efflux pump